MGTQNKGEDKVRDGGMPNPTVVALPGPEHAIAWGQDGGKTFDKAYDHRWHLSGGEGGRQCRDCGMWYHDWDGYPCLAKAEHVSYWVPRR